MTNSGDVFPLVSVVVLTYNSRSYIENCLDAVSRLSYPHFEVVVVDNASLDGTADLIAEKYPSVHLLKSRKNVGFAAGNNLGILHAKGDYIFLLNPDTEVDSLCVNHLLDVMNSEKEVFVCGAKIRLLDRRDMIQHAGGKYSLLGVSIDRGMYEFDNGQYDSPEEVTFVCGAGMLIQRSLVSCIGPLDSSFFLYHEDVDFCIRTWFSGGKVMYVPKALVYHKSGYLTAFEQQRSNPLVVFHKHKNTFVILFKNFSLTTIFCWFPVSVLYRLFWVFSFLLKHDAKSALAVIKATVYVFKNFRKINQDRIKISKLKVKTEHQLAPLFNAIKDALQMYKMLSKH